MAITPTVELADFASGIGTAHTIDNVNDRNGVGTTVFSTSGCCILLKTGLTTYCTNTTYW